MNKANFHSKLYNKTNICQVCLATENIRVMRAEEINWYQNILIKMQPDTLDYSICGLCAHLMKKYVRFHTQCQNAYKLLNGAYQDMKPELPSHIEIAHNLSVTNPETHYLGPETSDLDISELKTEIQYDSVLNGIYTDSDHHKTYSDNDSDYHKTYSDDDVPLVMLGRSNEVKATVTVKKRRKKPKDHEQNIDIKKEDLVEESKEKKKSGVKRCKELREGFSSRMVQETAEYTVIKLSKDQVLHELRERLNSEKYTRALYKCGPCAQGFNFEDVLNKHMLKHTQEHGTFKCEMCSQYCPSAVSLRGHVKSHTTRYRCKVCGSERRSRQHLLEHHARAHCARAALYSCQHCAFRTDKRTVMQRHVRAHRPGAACACAQCGRVFRSAGALRVHAARHDKSRSLQCDQCARRFIYPSLLEKHVQSVHVQREYYCVECDVRFKSPDNLRLHFKKAKRHRDATSYTHSCPQCPQRFVSSSALCAHQSASHGGHKSFSCALCGRLYASRDSLRSHQRRLHHQGTEHVCPHCQKHFNRKSLLVAHIRTHTEASCQPIDSQTNETSTNPLI